MSSSSALGPDLSSRVARAAGSRVASARPVAGGYTAARRFVVSLEDGRSAFLKAATDGETAAWLAAEAVAYRGVRADFLPALLAWDPTSLPFLLLEDLSHARWPPPWGEGDPRRVVSTLERVHATPPPAGLPTVASQADEIRGWPRVEADPRPFLSLGLVTSAWLARALPALARAEADLRLDGDDLLHMDVRSDNLCFAGDRTVLVDWSWACVGNGDVEVGYFLPSLHLEGGPAPEEVLPRRPDLAACVTSWFARHAGLPPPAPGSRVREVQRAQLLASLPWAVRALGLPSPDGPLWERGG
jgi:hypothetical protein